MIHASPASSGRLSRVRPTAAVGSGSGLSGVIFPCATGAMPVLRLWEERGNASGGAMAELLRFLATSAGIFVVAFVVVNIHAITEVLAAQMGLAHLEERRAALEELPSAPPAAPVVAAGGDGAMFMGDLLHASAPQVPELGLGVAPQENRIVIPKIGRNVPIVDIADDALWDQDWERLENQVQDALRDGVVRYPGTAQPGEVGNVFLTGHSSYYVWDPGRYKDVFALLHDLHEGDEFFLFWEQKKYHYRIRERKVVSPEQTDVLAQPTDEKIITLMTCTPIGTAKNRLILVAEQL